MHPLLPTLVKNLKDTVLLAIGYAPPQRALVVYDRQSALAALITDGYKEALPEATFLDFEQTGADEIRALMNTLSPRDLVILVQSSSFRLNDFRFRLELFNRSLAVIEHPHLGRMPEPEHQTYVESLAYDKAYYRTVGPKLKAMIDSAKEIIVSCDDTELVYTGPFETAKLNTGDYTGMKNIGGQFPIGEVFTELVDLSSVNGKAKIFGFADRAFHVIVPETPVTITIEKGIIVDTENATPGFIDILDQIKTDELLSVRELGFGMNRAMTRTNLLTDIGSYERMCGIHLSLGAKHTIYAKPGFSKRQSRYHVDIFVDVTTVTIDGQTIFKDGAYTV